MLTRFHASDRERTVISKTVRRVTGSTTWDCGAAAERWQVRSARRICSAGQGRRATFIARHCSDQGIHTPHLLSATPPALESPSIAGATTLEALRIDCRSVD